MGGDEEEHRVDAEDEDEGDDCLDPEDDVTRLDGNNCIFILGVEKRHTRFTTALSRLRHDSVSF